MLRDWNFWCSIFTALTAVLALVLSVYQIRLSNKQNLFDRRLKTYMLTSGLISLCKENYMWISGKRETRPRFDNDYVFIYLTPVYNFINGRVAGKPVVLKPLSQQLILYVFRYF